jgi:hypothetical protein
MKHVRRGLVLGAMVILLGIAAAYSPHRDFQRASTPTESGTVCELAPVENCDPDQTASTPSPSQHATGAVPTLAPPRPAAGVAGGAACESGPRGQVVYVTIEAEATAARQN